MSDIDDYACASQHYRCDACNDVWDCTDEGWYLTDIECHCLNESGHFDTGACPYDL